MRTLSSHVKVQRFLNKKIWCRGEKTLCLVLFDLECEHRDDKEEGNPRNSCDEAHVDFKLHDTPAAGQD